MACRSCWCFLLFFLYIAPWSSVYADTDESIQLIETTEIASLTISGATPEKSEPSEGESGRKQSFIAWLVPQIEQAREEIGHLLSIHIPNSLIVAQAILESGWGTSYGAKNRQNLFGLTRKNGRYMEFSSSLDSVKKHMLILEKFPSYRTLRTQLGKTTNPLELTKHLKNYCDCSGYSGKLNKIIRENDLAQLDQ